MKRFHVSSSLLVLLLCSLAGAAQQVVATNTNVAVPPLINFSGTLADASGKPLTSSVAATFSLYSEQTGGAALWIETQNVTPDSSGHYTVMLGSTSSAGLPANIFVAGEAHWLGVQIEGEAEQPRVLIVSAPYALKAGDAQTLGGLPASAFVLTAPASTATTAASDSASAAANGSVTSATTSDVTTSGGTENAVPLFTTSTNIQNSILVQSGRAAISVAGKLNLPATGIATSSAGKDSQVQTLVASSYNSSTSAAVTQTFQWQAEPAGNDTSSPSGSLNLLFGSGTATPAETGLNIASNGLITFATGQTFPGTGDGTITGVTAGTDLTGGGTSGNVTLNVNTSALNSTYAQLGAANTFTGNQAITGNLTDTGNITATGSISAASETVTSTTGTAVNVTGLIQGLYVTATATTDPVAVNAATSNGTAVYGQDSGTNSTSTGVLGLSSSPTGVGVLGEANNSSSSSQGVGVYGTSASQTGIGVEGRASAASGEFGIGVYGTAANLLGIGVEGNATGAYGLGGLFYGGPSGSASGGSGLLAYGGADTSSAGYGAGNGGTLQGGLSANGQGGDGLDAYAGGTNSSTQTGGNGVLAFAGIGAGYADGFPIAGVSAVGPYSGTSSGSDGPGVFGSDSTMSSTGGGYLGFDIGVWGDAGQGQYGVIGTGENSIAVLGENNSSSRPALSAQNQSSSSTAQAIVASDSSLSEAIAIIGGTGCSGTMGIQFALGGMSSNCENYTLQGDGSGNTYLNASGSGKIVFRINNGSNPSPMAVNNNGSVTIGTLDVTNSLTKPSGSFKIDHPLDPANKYLYHSFVESPDMMNIYNGNIATDGEGLATVTLPDWFEALNKDFRYQLTVIGQFAQAIVAHKIENNQFQIRTSLPNVEVSWQVTGIRQDAFANAHRIQTEVEKAPQDRGHYLHPELFGAPETARIGYEAPSVLAPAEVRSADASAPHHGAITRRTPPIQHRPLPAPRKLPAVQTPPKPITTQASR